MANPQTENGYLQIANDIWNEVIRRDFSKRQKDIILFIWRLSYGCKKKTAFVPMLKDFELCGVGYSNITKELKYLVEMKVISWEREDSIFSVNKDYERWQVSPVRGWDEDRFKNLVHQNIEKKTYQNDKPKAQKKSPQIIIAYQNDKSSLIKMISRHLSKQEVKVMKIPYRTKIHRVSKERFKEIFKKINSATTAASAQAESESKEPFFTAYRRVFLRDLTPFQVEQLGKYIDDEGFEESVINRAIERSGMKSGGISLVIKILNDYANAGAKTLVGAVSFDNEFEEKKAAAELRRDQYNRPTSQRRGSGKPPMPVVENKDPPPAIDEATRARMLERARRLKEESR